MTIDDQIKDKKLKYDVNREAAKIYALSSGKINKYEYLRWRWINLPSNQKWTIEQANFTYSPLGNAFKKQKTKTIEVQGQKQVDALKTLKPEELEAIKDNNFDGNEKLNISKFLMSFLMKE